MNSGNTDLTSWAEKELRLINHIEVFQNKPAILKKVESRLVALQKSLEEDETDEYNEITYLIHRS